MLWYYHTPILPYTNITIHQYYHAAIIPCFDITGAMLFPSASSGARFPPIKTSSAGSGRKRERISFRDNEVKVWVVGEGGRRGGNACKLAVCMELLERKKNDYKCRKTVKLNIRGSLHKAWIAMTIWNLPLVNHLMNRSVSKASTCFVIFLWIILFCELSLTSENRVHLQY